MQIPNDDRITFSASRQLSLILLYLISASLPTLLCAQEQPWSKDPVIMAVIALRQQETAAMLAGTAAGEAEKYSSTFVANTPDRGVIHRAAMLEFLKSGTIKYASIDMNIEYAGAHGDDMIVIMGMETVVPGAGMPNAGQHVQRRFTDIYRKENGIWRHDLRHANIVKVE